MLQIVHFPTFIILLVIILVTSLYYYKDIKKYKDYADVKLNLAFYDVCDYMINFNVVIENAIDNEYILENDLAYLTGRFSWYVRSLSEINDILVK
jgi:hypothetical protein